MRSISTAKEMWREIQLLHQDSDNHMLDLLEEFHSFQAQTGESILSYMARFLVLFDKLKTVGIDMTKVIPMDHPYWYILANRNDLINHFGLKPESSGDFDVQILQARTKVRSHVSQARSKPPKLKIRQLNAIRVLKQEQANQTVLVPNQILDQANLTDLSPRKNIAISTVLDVLEGDLAMSCANAPKPEKVLDATP